MLANVKWLKNTFGTDCIAAHLHVDERTPHIHAVIVPMFEKAPTMPKNKRKGETQAHFDLRVERAKKKRGRKVVSHHKHYLFGAGRKSYEKVVDSYAAAVEHLGIERSERGSEATPTTKQDTRPKRRQLNWRRDSTEQIAMLFLRCLGMKMILNRATRHVTS